MITGVNDKTNHEKRLQKIPVVPEYETQPDYGWYRTRTADATSWNRHFFYYGAASGRLCCRTNGQPVAEDRAIEIWVWARQHPITQEVYDAVERGEPWPDDHPLIGLLHNRPPDEDTREWLNEQLEPLMLDAQKLIKAGPAKTEEAAADAAMKVSLIAALEKRIEAAKAKERAPLWAKVKKCDEDWKGLQNNAAIHQQLKLIVHTPWLIAKRREKEAAEAKARAEAEEARRLAREAQRRADEEAAMALVSGDAAAAVAAEEAAAVAKATAQDAAFASQVATEITQRTVTVGTPGHRGIHLRTTKKVIIKDASKVFEVFKTNVKVLDALQKAAEAAIRSGMEVPGVEIELVEKAT